VMHKLRRICFWLALVVSTCLSLSIVTEPDLSIGSTRASVGSHPWRGPYFMIRRELDRHAAGYGMPQWTGGTVHPYHVYESPRRLGIAYVTDDDPRLTYPNRKTLFGPTAPIEPTFYRYHVLYVSPAWILLPCLALWTILVTAASRGALAKRQQRRRGFPVYPLARRST
jgi:hypothetical protein